MVVKRSLENVKKKKRAKNIEKKETKETKNVRKVLIFRTTSTRSNGNTRVKRLCVSVQASEDVLTTSYMTAARHPPISCQHAHIITQKTKGKTSQIF